ncbi:MAG: hypothetical protein PHV32_17475, partial [Eubacteriales bacterium]|nr:hypothetical protein [Eubacteriales bacterium]
DLLQAITETLNIAIEKPNLIEPDTSQDGYYPSLEVKRLSNEISRTLEGFDFDKEQLKTMILKCAAEKYKNIKSDQHITDILKVDFEKSSPLSTFNKELFDKTVLQIKLTADGMVYLILKNRQTIGKESGKP